MQKKVGRTKMDKGNLQDCLRKILHHLGDPNLEAIKLSADRDLLSKEELTEAFVGRCLLVRGEVEMVQKMLQRIAEVAERQDNKEVLDILNEQFEFGHDIPEKEI
jgi:hypothetical protein